MFTDVQCPVCARRLRDEGVRSYELSPANGNIPHVLLKASPVALAECFHGHKIKVVVGDGAYALLFERSLHRLVTGATRDAVIDAHTALEMFWVHAVARAGYDRQEGASPAKLIEEIRSATKTSERAHGAALAAIWVISGQAAKPVESRTTELRNGSAHAGSYPSEPDTERMILDVERFVVESEQLLGRQPCVNAVPYGRAFVTEETRRCLREGDQALGVGLVAMGTALDMCHVGKREPSVKGRLADYRERVLEGASFSVW